MKYLIISLVSLMFCYNTFGQTPKIPVNYLEIKTPFSFENNNYFLAWSAFAKDDFYRQEFLKKSDYLEKFKKLVILDIKPNGSDYKLYLNAKILELEELKKTRAIVKYEKFEKDGEAILEFMLSQATPDGRNLRIIERFIYRYLETVDTNGVKCVVVFGVSERAYEEEISDFFSYLKENRTKLITSIESFKIPNFTIPN